MRQVNHNHSDSQQLATQLEVLSARVRELQRQVEKRPRSAGRAARWLALLGAGASVLLLAPAAESQAEECSSMLPFCFSSGTPARAAEVNENFTTLADAVTGLQDDLAAKVDQDAAGNVNVAGQLGVGMYLKQDCVIDAGVATTDCSCAAGEVAIGGGGWSAAGRALLESVPNVNELDTWRITCVDVATGLEVACAGMRVICAKINPVP